MKVYVYPLQRHEGDELQTIQTLKVNSELQPLYDYLVGRGSFVQLDNFNPKYLPIFSRDVLKRIASGDESWDEMVPPQVAEIIRQRGFSATQKRSNLILVARIPEPFGTLRLTEAGEARSTGLCDGPDKG